MQPRNILLALLLSVQALADDFAGHIAPETLRLFQELPYWTCTGDPPLRQPVLISGGGNEVETGEYELGFQIGDSTLDWTGVFFAPSESSSHQPPFPLVIYAHGARSLLAPGAWRGFDYALRALALNGFMAVSLDLGWLDQDPGPDLDCSAHGIDDSAQCQVWTRGEIIRAHLDVWNNAAKDPDEKIFHGRFFEKIDMNRVGLVGNSQGGEAALLVHDKMLSDTTAMRVRAVHAIAPTDHFKLRARDVPYYVIQVGDDDDTESLEGGRVFDRTVRSRPAQPVIQAFLHGAIHNGFNTRECPPPPSTRCIPPLPLERHLVFEGTTAVLFFGRFLKENLGDMRVFDGSARLEQLDNVPVFWSFQHPQHMMIDDYEQTDQPSAERINTQQGRNEPYALTLFGNSTTLDIFEEHSFARENGFNFSFFHDTRGLIAGWRHSNFQALLAADGFYMEPRQGQTWNTDTYGFLAFRVAQVAESQSQMCTQPGALPAGEPYNIEGQDQDFSVGIEKPDGSIAWVQIGSIAGIPYPYTWTSPCDLYNTAAPFPESTKTVLQTVRIPLSCFSISPGAGNAISRIHFRFDRRPSGLLAIDDVQLSQ